MEPPVPAMPLEGLDPLTDIPSGVERSFLADVDPAPIEVVDFGRGRLLQKGVRFPVVRFGTYVAAIEEDR